jgi:hypothetical protein
MYYKEDYKTNFQGDSNEDFIILSHIVQKLWRINHFRAKFKRPAKKYYRRRDTKAGFKKPRWRVKPPIFHVSGFGLSNAVKICFFVAWYDFCLLLAQFCDIILYVRKFRAMCKSRTGVHLGKFPVERRNSFCRSCNFSGWLSVANSQAGQAEVTKPLMSIFGWSF